MIFGLLPKEEAFFDLFKQAAHNVIEGSRLLKELMEDYANVQQKIERIKEVEHIGDGITHDIALRLNQTFLTPLDREDIHDLASALDDILDAVEAVADRFAIYKITQPTESAIRLGDILYRASVAVGRGVDHIAMSHEEVKEYGVQVNSLENEADRVSRDAISELFEKEANPIAVIKWKEIYETFEEGTDRCEDVANVIERIVLKQT
ncbi:MAG: phosphate transport regulator [Nitrospira sp.]|jgi:predicted phosphate transport protein (TIGR00153 family)|nr:MAG: phosphate transport regulator [Nitrospira sp.]